jgi:uncharacterized membrane protein
MTRGRRQPVEYLLLKWLHVLSSTVLLGTGAGIAFFLVRACRTRDPVVIAAVALQLRLRNQAQDAARLGTPREESFWRTFRWWCALGVPALIGVLAIFWMMVSKTGFQRVA